MSLKKYGIRILCGGLISSSLMISTVFAGSTQAYIYGFNYDEYVNTLEIAEQQQMYLSNMGYTAYCNTDVDAEFAIGISPNTGDNSMNSAVIITNGHSGPGSYELKGNGSSTYLTAKKSGGLYRKFDNIDMSNCTAALFFGCQTNSDARKKYIHRLQRLYSYLQSKQ